MTTKTQDLKLTPMESRIVEEYKLIPILGKDGRHYVKTTCRRCGGSGSYSYCQQYGTRCYDCSVASGGKRIGWEWVELKKAIARIRRSELKASKDKQRQQERAAHIAAEQARVSMLGFVSLDELRAEAKAYANRNLTTFGIKGERIELSVKFLGASGFETHFGERVIARFEESVTKSSLVWFTSWNALPYELERDNVFRIKGTVKDHQEYNGKPQTVLTRVTLVT